PPVAPLVTRAPRQPRLLLGTPVLPARLVEEGQGGRPACHPQDRRRRAWHSPLGGIEPDDQRSTPERHFEDVRKNARLPTRGDPANLELLRHAGCWTDPTLKRTTATARS